MCTHCGCSTDKASLIRPSAISPASTITLEHDHATLHLQESLLAGNDAIAATLREQFTRQHMTCINLMGTPGAGKTQLLEALLQDPFFATHPVAVLEGDQQSNLDAQRVAAAGGNVLQINTGTGCHLDASMIQAGVNALSLRPDAWLFIENVGNLVCPALFDLGETTRIAMMAVTDGDDKPIKYPHMFSHCDLVLVNKIDLLPHVDFALPRMLEDIAKLNPGCPVFTLSAKTGEGLSTLITWLHTQHTAHG